MIRNRFQQTSVRLAASGWVRTGSGLLALAVLGMACLPARANAAPISCAALAGLDLPMAHVVQSETVSAGAFVPPPTNRGVTDPQLRTLGEFCRVRAAIRPSPDSDIEIEVWLPARDWNGRFVAVGNGGFQSTLPYPAMAAALAKGYAVAGSNAGHDTSDGNFAIHHPQKLIDWGNRAIHEMTVKAKAIVAAHYGRPARWSYWNSCSTGGRQGLNAAERYPDDFDGLAIGAPANPMTRLQLGSIWNNLAVNRTADSFIPHATWLAIHAAVLAQCDAADGIADGLINDPLRCAFDPARLACTGTATPECLTPDQLTALRAIYAGARNPRTGAQIYPGWAPGFEGNMPGPTAGKVPQQDAVDTFRIVLDDPTWDYHTADFDTIVARSDAVGNATINAADPAALHTLFRRGGKILLYHGWHDVGISALGSLEYYRRAVDANGGDAATRNSIRLFLAPGMNHCEGGDGPNQFDKLDLISAWVERGQAPDRIVAAHYNSAGHIDRTRPICAFPKLAKWDGVGSSDDAASFACADPDAVK